MRLSISISVLLLFVPLVFMGQAHQESNIRKEKVQAVRIKKTVSVSTEKKLDAPSESHQPKEEKYQSNEPELNQAFKTEEYWFNSYQTTRNTSLLNDGKIDSKEQTELNLIVEKSAEFIQGTFSWNYLQLRKNRNNADAQLYYLSAVKLDPLNPLIAAESAWLAERTGNVNLRNKALKSCKSNGTISSFQTVFSRWMLEVIPEGSLIITNGEFDTYPIWELKEDKKVHVISLAMIQDASWLKRTLNSWDKTFQFPGLTEEDLLTALLSSKKPVYFSFTIRQELIEKYKANLFPVGPLCKFSKESSDNIQALKNFYFNAKRIKYLETLKWKDDKYADIVNNLIPGLFILEKSNKTDPQEKNQVIKMRKLIENSNSNSVGK